MCSDNNLVVSGRAHKNIFIGDKLVASINRAIESKEYTVNSILSYRKQLNYLHEGMTGSLLVNGNYSLVEIKESPLYHFKPSIEHRYNFCIELLNKKFVTLNANTINLIKGIESIDFFDEIIRYI